MKQLFCLLCVGFACFSCNPFDTRVQDVNLEYNSGTKTWTHDGELFDGVVYHEWRNGELRQEILCVNGQGNGPTGWYAWDGDLVFEGTMKNGNLEGSGRHYHDNGKLQSIDNYKNDELHGTVEYYDENGKLSYTMKFKDGEKIEGSYINRESR